jgi:hypothetical protein
MKKLKKQCAEKLRIEDDTMCVAGVTEKQGSEWLVTGGI